jgi:hypothetical protein
MCGSFSSIVARIIGMPNAIAAAQWPALCQRGQQGILPVFHSAIVTRE